MILHAIEEGVLRNEESLLFFKRRPEAANSYEKMVPQFEATAGKLLAWVNDLIEDAYRDHAVVADEKWKMEALFLATELGRLPWRPVKASGPCQDKILHELYRAWAEGCTELGQSLRSLAANNGRRSTGTLIGWADEGLAAVTAHTAARKIYLKHARPWLLPIEDRSEIFSPIRGCCFQ